MIYVSLANHLAESKLSFSDELVFIKIMEIKVELTVHHIIVRVTDERIRVFQLKSEKQNFLMLVFFL